LPVSPSHLDVDWLYKQLKRLIMATKSAENGQAKKPAVKKGSSAEKSQETPVVRIANEGLKKMVEFQQTVDRISELQKLVDDYSKVTDTLKGLSEFKCGTGESVQFNLQDLSNDNTFVTYNSTLINMVLTELVSKLKEKQTQLIDKILNFSM
jgi:hypothetical protein